MISYLSKHPNSFDPETVQVLVNALDEAVERVRARGTIDGEDRKTRDALAKAIVDAAKQGERDPQRLVEKALLEFRL